MTQYVAKVFMNGRSQAIRLPKEFRFETDTVYLRKEGKDVIISAIETNWDVFFDQASAFDDNFMSETRDLPAQQREDF